MGADVMAQVLAGVVAVPIINVLKRYLKLAGVPMSWVAFIISFFIATWVAFTTGQVSFALAYQDPVAFLSELGKAAGIVFSIATLVYKTVSEKLKLGG